MNKNKAEFNRRKFIVGAASASALAITGFPAIGQAHQCQNTLPPKELVQ